MKPTEAAALLTIAAAYDNRKPDPDQAKAWALALDGLRFEDCRDVIVAHYQRSREWLMPFDVRSGVKKLRDKRIADHPVLTPPPAPEHLSEPAQVAWQNEWRKDANRRIGDGEVIDCDAAYGELKPRNLADLRQLSAAMTTDPTTPDPAQEEQL